jgi:hypothetical protein
VAAAGSCEWCEGEGCEECQGGPKEAKVFKCQDCNDFGCELCTVIRFMLSILNLLQ